MPDSPFIAAGAAVQPVPSAPLNTNRFFTGIWTNRSPVRDAATPYLYEKFYSASRYDSIIRGSNVEITSKLSLRRRSGSSVYNSSTFPPINRFFEFRSIVDNKEKIQILASCDSGVNPILHPPTVRDVTGPSTNRILVVKAGISLGSSAFGRTSFVAVQNTVYMGDGLRTDKMLNSGTAWKPTTAFTAGQWIVDENGNIQEAVGAQTGTLANIQISGNATSLFFSPSSPMSVVPEVQLTLAGLTTLPALNGLTMTISEVESTFQVTVVPFTHPDLPYTVETGTATTGTGISGATEPVWSTVQGQVTQDGTLQWVNRGSQVQGWQPAAPTTAPIVTQAAAPTIYQLPAVSTWYAPLFIVEDSNNNLQQLATGGQLGASAPAWPTTPIGQLTPDGTAEWKLLGPSTWTASFVYAIGDVIKATFTYYITTTGTYFDHTIKQWVTGQVTTAITVTCLFQCVVAGTSGPIPPAWVNGVGTTTNDGGVVAWQNMGTALPYTALGASENVSTAATVLDPNGNTQKATTLAITGPAAPTDWAVTQGAYTKDGNQTWQNTGPFGAANTGAWIYAYSYQDDIDNATSTASPPSQPITVSQNSLAVIQGDGSGDPQVGKVVIWRTAQGGSTLVQLDVIPNPGAGQTWVYTDTVSDLNLNEFITAPISHSADGPPAGFIPTGYHLGRIWGFVGATLYYSAGPDAFPFNGNGAFPPNNIFRLPALGVVTWPTSIGLVVVTTSGSWIILGQGTAASGLYIVPYQDDVSLLAQDCFCNQGSTCYLMDSSRRVLSMDPGAGELETGFAIADQFEALYDPHYTWLAWHPGGSRDTALFVADGSQGWFRMSPLAAPESGNVWSPHSAISHGIQAIASVETVPGTRVLLLGPKTNGQPILMRDLSVNTDNGVEFDAYCDFGSVVIAQPGTQAGVQFITTETSEFGLAPAVSILVNEVHETATKKFKKLRYKVTDPPNLPVSETLPANRFYAMQSPKVVLGRHLQVRIEWAPEDAPNELFSYTIYGRLPEKARK